MLVIPSYAKLLLALAVLPSIFLCVQVYRSDRIEKEPPRLLLALLICGVLSTIPALWGERFGGALLGRFLPEESLAYGLFYYIGVVGLSEEGSKYLFLRWRTWREPEFNYQFDGIVYAVFVSMGFALWENIHYVSAYGLSTALLRAFTAVPGHACFAVFMGAWYGAAKGWALRGFAGRSRLCRCCALVLSVLFHGLYDLVASLGAFSWLYIGFVLVLFGASFLLTKRCSQRDRALY